MKWAIIGDTTGKLGVQNPTELTETWSTCHLFLPNSSSFVLLLHIFNPNQYLAPQLCLRIWFQRLQLKPALHTSVLKRTSYANWPIFSLELYTEMVIIWTPSLTHKGLHFSLRSGNLIAICKPRNSRDSLLNTICVFQMTYYIWL